MWGKEILQTMQEFTCNIDESKIVKLSDSRDGNTYTVSKLKDQMCWMTQNLKISDKTLIPSTSDVSKSFVLPKSNAEGFSNYNTSYVYIDWVYGGYYSWFAATAGEGVTSKYIWRGLTVNLSQGLETTISRRNKYAD